jgi:hypothetical protein
MADARERTGIHALASSTRPLANDMTSSVVSAVCSIGNGSNCSTCYTEMPATTGRCAVATSGFPTTREAHWNRAEFPNCGRRESVQKFGTCISSDIPGLRRECTVCSVRRLAPACRRWPDAFAVTRVGNFERQNAMGREFPVQN